MDAVEHLAVASGRAEREAHVGRNLAETALLHEDPELLAVSELVRIGVGAELPERAQLRDLGVDGLHPDPAGDGDTMVAVQHEVRVTELADHDRREVPVGEPLRQPLPA